MKTNIDFSTTRTRAAESLQVTRHRRTFDRVATARSSPNETLEATKETEPLIECWLAEESC